MLDLDAFVTALYVTVDDFCQRDLPPEARGAAGPPPSLSRSEVVALSCLGQLCRFQSERDFWRFARRRLGHLFPRLPERSRFNRLQRRHARAAARFAVWLAARVDQGATPVEAVDRVGVATRWCGRRGAGWLEREADKGHCSRLGFFHGLHLGLHLMTAVSQAGAVTGFCVGPASCKDQPHACAFLCARAYYRDELPWVGAPATASHYALDKGFAGRDWHRLFCEAYKVAGVHCAPIGNHAGAAAWGRGARRWLASVRQIVETAHEKLLNFCRPARERPHEYEGFFARLCAKVALHNFCIHLNRQHGRPNLAFADLIDWGQW